MYFPKLIVALALCWSNHAWSQNWGELAQISSTLGVQPNRLCIGEASRCDIGCPTYAPFIGSNGEIGIGTGDVTATLTISSSTGRIWAYSSGNGRTIDIYAGSSAIDSSGPTAAFHINRFSAQNILLSSGGGDVGVGLAAFNTPSTTLHVSGTIRIADSGEACDANRAGAIRFAGGIFEFCEGTAPWKSMGAIAAVTAASDRIVSGSTSVVANTGGSISFSTAGVKRMVISSLGYVGIGTDVPSGMLHTSQSGSGLATDFILDVFSDNIGSSGIAGRKARGTVGSPAAVAANDYLFNLGGRGYGSTQFSISTRANIGFLAAENWTDAAQGTYIRLDTTNVGSTARLERMRITATGDVGIGRTDPSATLDVSGSVKVAGTGSETCGPTTRGSIRHNPVTGKLEICRY